MKSGPAGDRAAKAVAASPEKSNRAIADEIGVGYETVRRVREKSGDPRGSPATPEKRTGRDGKKYPAKPQRSSNPKKPVIARDQEKADARRAWAGSIVDFALGSNNCSAHNLRPLTAHNLRPLTAHKLQLQPAALATELRRRFTASPLPLEWLAVVLGRWRRRHTELAAVPAP